MVIILGNGFDLNLGLKTRYQDFVRSKHFTDLLYNGNSLAAHLQERSKPQKWIDIENELKYYSCEIYRGDDRGRFKREYRELCQSLCNYLNEIDYNAIDVDSKAYKKIIELCKGGDDITIYNFNYTKSIEHIISTNSLETQLIDLVQIHGKAADYDIIFGVEDGAEIDKRDVFILKSTSPYFACEVDLPLILKSEKYIHIIGHSLGETDHFYFKEFFNHQSLPAAIKKYIHITHYGDDGRDEIMMQLNEMTVENISILRQRNYIDFVDMEVK